MLLRGVRHFGLFLLAVFLGACASYRSNVGPYRTASDYDGAPSAGRQPDSAVKTPYHPTEPFRLSWPVAFKKVNRGFRPASAPSHSGLDLGGRRGLPVMAAHEGRVIYRGHDFNGYGNMVIVEYDKEWATLYAHLDSFSVKEGQVVARGQTLGGMGSTGHATGVHLHFELLHRQQPIDPASRLKSRPLETSLR